MDQINPLDLVGNETLNYDLCNVQGDIMYRKGDPVTPGFLMKLNYQKVYKKPEIIQIPEPNPNLYKIEEREFETVLSSDFTDYLIKNAGDILKGIEEGGSPDLSICTETSNNIFDQVSDKISKIDCVGQLRIYDEYTYSHTLNVSSLSTAIAIKCGLDKDEVKNLAMGALLHDIGKMRVSKNILHKPGKLEPGEFEIMKNHTTYGYEILTKEMKINDNIAQIAYQHQEKYSGKGYPRALKGNEISQWAQIASVADVYDALISKRVYKEPISSADALKIMVKDGSFSFNPSILYKFIYIANYKNSSDFIIKE
jgi:putative nucleotidyltransferase with HDIG domain